MGRLKKKEFQPTEDHIKYLKVYVDNPSASRKECAKACGVSLDRVVKWYGAAEFVQWLLAKTSKVIDDVVLAAARRRVAIDMNNPDSKAGSEAALKIYLREIDRRNNANFTKGGNNPLAVILQVGTDAGSGNMHPAAEIIEQQAENADFEAPRARKGRKKK